MLKNVVFRDNIQQSGALVGSQALEPNAIILPVRRTVRYVTNDRESDVESVYNSYRIFTPEDTKDEAPKRKVAFANANRFFFIDEDSNQERVDFYANLGDKVLGEELTKLSIPAVRTEPGKYIQRFDPIAG